MSLFFVILGIGTGSWSSSPLSLILRCQFPSHLIHEIRVNSASIVHLDAAQI